ncbi:6712_t:CDS:2, partial [Racocetra persica]
DITEALSSRRKEGIPQFLMGHSMGGGLVIKYILDGPERHNIAGLISSAPLLQTTPKAKSLTDDISLFALPIASKLMPNVTWNADINTKFISRDPVEVKKYVEDPLIHSMGSLRTLGDMISIGKLLMAKECIDINIPIYIAHGSDDMITDPNASKLLIEKTKSKDKTFHEWDG